METNKINRQDT